MFIHYDDVMVVIVQVMLTITSVFGVQLFLPPEIQQHHRHLIVIVIVIFILMQNDLCTVED